MHMSGLQQAWAHQPWFARVPVCPLLPEGPFQPAASRLAAGAASLLILAWFLLSVELSPNIHAGLTFP